MRRNALVAYLASLACVACAGWACSGEPSRADAQPTDAGLLAAGGGRSFASFGHTCAVAGSGVQCWGANDSAQLGDGFASRRSPLPVKARRLGAGVSAVAAGGAHSCAIAAGEVHCWGSNDRRQLGQPSPAIVPEPTPVPGLPGSATAVSAGGEHTCAIDGGALWCWGLGTRGQLGQIPEQRCGGYRAAARCSATPVRVAGIEVDGSRPLQGVGLGREHTCAIADGAVWCFGAGTSGQLGDGRLRDRPTPALVSGLAGRATHVGAGDAYSCALVDGAVLCWGANDRGQLGDATTTGRATPTPVQGLDAGVALLAVGDAHACALRAGSVWCWGANDSGQLGADSADRTPDTTPVRVEGITERVIALAAGADHSCALVATDPPTATCWGADDFGQRGDGARSRAAGPTRVAAWDDGSLRDRNGDGSLRIACVGDSNTQAGGRPAPAADAADTTWCEGLQALAAGRVETLNLGWNGATAVSKSLRRGEDPLDYALDLDDVDAVILAFGTNDLLQGATSEELLLAYLHLVVRSREAGVDAFVATTPPAPGESETFAARVAASNAVLREVLREDRLIDFDTSMQASDFADAVHVDTGGHAKRARAAWDAVRAALPPAPLSAP